MTNAIMNPAELFYLALFCTGGLYVCLLAYFNGLVGTKRPNSQILWNSEPIIWFITVLFMVSVVFRLIGPSAGSEGPSLWYLIGAGNLLVIYTYLILKLAGHDLPEKICWCVAALCAVVIIYMIVDVVLALFSATLDLALYADKLGLLLALLTLILLLLLIFLLTRSLLSSVMQIWSAEANAPERLTAGGITVTSIGNVTNPEGALSDISQTNAKPEAEWAIVYPEGGIIIDFGVRRIEDHGFRSDLRIVRANSEQPVTVEVSNDKLNWLTCFQDDKIFSDWDVPYYNNPWRYVRICNKGNEPTRIAEVYDLD